ncbi:MAG TPA: metallophosphoesterase [Limnochordia bacterium]|nr:metallophosphoesterase [Limnochordia bacterium]
MRRRIDFRHWGGPFDIIGDVHGCAAELENLLSLRGYACRDGIWRHPARRALFVGDLVNRGPDDLGVVALVRGMVEANQALCAKGNHDKKTARWALGAPVQLTNGLEETARQVASHPDAPRIKAELADFLGGLPPYLWLEDGELVVVHGAMRADFIGRTGPRIESLALYGDVMRIVDGMPQRRDWTPDYRGRAFVVYGHTPVDEPYWNNNTVNIDTGAVFGGRLTCLLWPERETVQVDCPRYALGRLDPAGVGQEKR